MRGVVFDLSLPRYALAKGLGRWRPSLYYGRGSCLSLRDVPAPRKPGPGWVMLEPIYAGICGTDLSTIYLSASPVMEHMGSTPCVLGHEIVARVVEASGPFREGDRVVVEPLLPCAIRGVPPCRGCSRGEPNRCEAFTRGHLAPGVMIGFHRDLPGGFGDRLVAHESQLFPVPDGVPDRRAVLTEPLAVGVHAVLKAPPTPEDRVFVIGGGMVAMSVLAALKLLGKSAASVTHMTLLPYQAEMARALGATEAIQPGTAEAVTAQVCRITGATPIQPILGDPIVVGGFDVVYDCVGTPRSLDAALRYARRGATIVLVGGAGVVNGLDWTFVWTKELRVVGTFCYGVEEVDSARRRTFQIVLDRLGDSTLAGPLDALVTHVFSLERYQDAVVANVDRGTHRSMKTVFAIGGSS